MRPCFLSPGLARRILGSLSLLLSFFLPRIMAGSATWLASPTSGDWPTAGNWTGGIIPGDSFADIATFGVSSVTDLTISTNNLLLDGLVFSAGAGTYTFAVRHETFLAGAGLTNQSGALQTFVTSGEGPPGYGRINFTGTASAGTNSRFVNNGCSGQAGLGGYVFFHDYATAGSAVFVNNPPDSGGVAGGKVYFHDHASAGDGTFTSVDTIPGYLGGVVFFHDDSTAGRGHFTNGRGGDLRFEDRSTAADGTFINEGGGSLVFRHASTAGRASLTNRGGAVYGAVGGGLGFQATSNAESATLVNEGATADYAVGGWISFIGTSDAGSATLINHGSARPGLSAGARTEFYENSTAGNATLIANSGSDGGLGGMISFFDDSSGGTARVRVFGNGNLDLSHHNLPGLTIASIEGSGNIFLGSRNLTVGTNNADTTFSGAIQDGGPNGGVAGSLTKTGSGMLALSGANSFTGGTTVLSGTLLANNVNGSAFGSGAVTVASGAVLGGSGFIAGATTLASGARLVPGHPTGTLTFTGGLVLPRGAVLDFRLGYGSASIDVAGGVLTILPGAGGVVIDLADVAAGVPYTLLSFRKGQTSGLSTAAFSFGRLPPGSTAADYLLTLTDTELILTRQGATRTVNLSARAYCGAGNRVTIGGFVVSGKVPKRLLVRAIGPSLTGQGLGAEEVLPDPGFEVHDALHGNAVIAINDNWGDNANLAELADVSTAVGATPLLASDTKSAAALLNLAPGIYTFVVKGNTPASGIVLLEVYDADPVSTGSNFVNIATRAYSTTGNGVTIGGFVISGKAPKQVLLRAVGPTLATQGLGVGEVLADPVIELHDASHHNDKIATNDNWGDNPNAADIVTTGARIGATPFDSADTKSSALLLTLNPGVYSFLASGQGAAPSGIVLVEVYDAD